MAVGEMLLPAFPELEDIPMTAPSPFSNNDEDIIGSATSVERAVDALARRGCLDLTSSIDPAALSSYPVATGGYCDVYRGKLYNGTNIAIKSLRICVRSEADDDGRKVLKRAARELYNWSKLRHCNVLPLIGLTIFRGHLSMVSEWMQNGNLMTYRRSNPDMGWIQPCADICAGLCYIHETGMVHGDLKAANVMVSPDGVAMIADFGNTQLRDLTLKFTNTTSTGLSLRWTAPELLLQDSAQRSKEADVYAYGMTMLEVISGKVPYEGFSDERVLFMVTLESKFPPCPQADASVELWELLTSCWNRDTSKRPSIKDISYRLQDLFQSELHSRLIHSNGPAEAFTLTRRMSLSDIRRDQQPTTGGVAWDVEGGDPLEGGSETSDKEISKVKVKDKEVEDEEMEDREMEEEETKDEEMEDGELKGDEIQDDELGRAYHLGFAHAPNNTPLHVSTRNMPRYASAASISGSHYSLSRSVEAMSICSTSVRGASPYPMSISGMSLRSVPASTVSIAPSVGALSSGGMSISGVSWYPIPGEARYLQLRALQRPIATQRPPQPTSRRVPLVYPALISRVAKAFRQRIPLSERTKDGLTYPVTFDGREAVGLIAYIIKTSDRNLALLLGRALDAQKFFHDVTYDHRLRDSTTEIYQFSGPRLAIATWETEDGGDGDGTPVRPGLPSPGQGSGSGSVNVRALEEEAAAALPSGVFTLLTECYSPTCTRNQLCYCSACPRRLEQITRQQSYRPQVTNSVALSPAASLDGTTIGAGSTALSKLRGNSSEESLIDHGIKEPRQLWIHSVPQEVVDSVSDQEKKRQEAINEVICTERDFVRDLEYLRDRWMDPLRTGGVITSERRIDIVHQVFWNIEDILDVNTRLHDLLTERQNACSIVETIGDIFSELVPHFEPFVQYAKHQLYGKHEFEKEKITNPAFASFVEIVERLPESRKLELNGYLTKPTTRLARYPLLLEAVLEHTPEDNPDRVAIPKVVKMVREFLGKVNEERDKTENRFNLLQLDKSLVYRPGEEVDLKLKDEQRRLVYKGPLRRRGGAANETADLQIFLFDHALLMVKSKAVNKQEQLKVFRRPIPLELLVVSTPEENSTRPESQKSGYQFTVSHLGKKGYSLTLWAPTVVARRKWVEHITAQQEAIHERTMAFDTFMLSEDVFVWPAKVNCSVPYDHGRRIAYGTDVGVYFQSLYEGQNRTPVRGIEIPDVQQIDVLEEYQLLVVLSERSVLTFPLDALDFADPLKRMKRISSHTSFFKAGYCMGRTLVCVVKASSLSSTIKTLEPIDQSVRGKNKPTFKKLLQGKNDPLKVFKEFYIPTESHSIHFLKTKLCVACTKGFEIVDLETLDTQALLDPADYSLDFVQEREDVRPVSIYRIDDEFLLCYTEFAFYVNKSGWRSKRNFTMYWEGSPTAFALHYPYVMAFDPMFIEIRHVDDGSPVQVIRGNNLRLLFADTQPSVMNSVNSVNSPVSSASSISSGSATLHSYASHSTVQGYNQYGHNASTQYGSMYGHAPHMAAYGHPHHRQRRAHERDEIIIVSDDKVMAVRLAAPPPHVSNVLAPNA